MLSSPVASSQNELIWKTLIRLGSNRREGSNRQGVSNQRLSAGLDRWEKCLRILLICCFSITFAGWGSAAVYAKGLGTPVISAGGLVASPSGVTFGAVPVGQTSSATVSFVNKGKAPVKLTQLNVTGQSFAVVVPSHPPITIASGGSYSLKVQFKPATRGATSGHVSVTSNSSTGATTLVSLSGNGTPPPPSLSGLSCSSGSVTGSTTTACTVKLTSSAGSGGFTVSLSSSNPAVTVPPSVTVPANATSAGFTATAKAVTTAQWATLTAKAGSISKSFVLNLNPRVPALSTSATSVGFGNVVVNTAATQSLTLTSTGTAPVTVNSVALSGTGYSVSGVGLPVTLSPGKTATLKVQFNPTTTGTATGQLSVASNSPANGTAVIRLSGTGTTPPATLSLLSCSSGSMTGAGKDACTVTLTAAAPSGGLTVNLSSNNSAVTVPSTMTVPAGATSAQFTATVASVASAQVVTVKASVGSMFTTFTMQLNATILALSVSPASVAFGNVVVNTPATQSITLTSTGTAPVTINGLTLTGTGFALSGPSLPVALTPNQATTIDISFDPTTASAVTGQLTISSNASKSSTTSVGVTGTAVPAISVTPASASITAGTERQFAASVTGTTNTAVTWTVSGAGCSGASCGTIASNGLYIAPAAIPSPATITVKATSVSAPTQSASSAVTIVPPVGATYYLAPASAGGKDSNNGLSPQKPWLTPNHSVNCGDVIIAASGNYPPGGFEYTFGKVTGSGHCFAFLKCATFDSCYLNGTEGSGNNGIFISQSHWAVMGFEVTNPSATSGNAACFKATPLTAKTITDIAFIDDIANGCGTGGFITDPYYGGGPYGVDYFVLIADIAYNTAQTNAVCASGVSVFEPANYDTLPGTHNYISQFFGWNNVNPAACGGTAATDGEGVIFDTFAANGYTGQTVLEDSIAIFNGAHGFESWGNASAPIYIKNNTAYANNDGPGLNAYFCGEIEVATAGDIIGGSVQVSNNIARTKSATGCGSHANYAFFAANVNGTNAVKNNLGYSPSAYNTNCNGVCTGFSFGTSNTFGTDPEFANAPASAPAAPSCGSSSSVIACMAPIVADFVPKAAGKSTYGYQSPSSTPIFDPLFPQWLCQYSSQLNGLLTMGCAAQ